MMLEQLKVQYHPNSFTIMLIGYGNMQLSNSNLIQSDRLIMPLPNLFHLNLLLVNQHHLITTPLFVLLSMKSEQLIQSLYYQSNFDWLITFEVGRPNYVPFKATTVNPTVELAQERLQQWYNDY